MTDVTSLLPQRRPFVMIGALTSSDDTATVTATLIEADCLLIEDGYLSAAGIIENMAQTCAARTGFINRHNRGAVPVGFIGGIRDFEVTRLPRIGETLVTTVTPVGSVMDMMLVEARSTVNGEQVAAATLKIALVTGR